MKARTIYASIVAQKSSFVECRVNKFKYAGKTSRDDYNTSITYRVHG